MGKTKIEWCDSSWNPVTGCLHDCPYCYARGISHRFGGKDTWNGRYDSDGSPIFDKQMQETRELHDLSGAYGLTDDRGNTKAAPYPYGFDPTFHRYRLGEMARKTKPRTIFVGSMTDLFGGWVPSDWIADVMDACLAAPQHRYLFLTKNPERYLELEGEGLLPNRDNFWYGTTAAMGGSPIYWSDKHNTFVSMEPILEPFIYPPDPAALKVDWIILGAETGNRKDKVIPERSWIESVVQFCKDTNTPLFMKNSLIPIWGNDIITEFPWET